MVETIYHIPGAPRIALLADLHGRDPAPVLASLRSHAPSLVCICGDILYGSHPEGDRSPLETQHNVLPFLSGCASLAPTFLSLGNHEWALDQADIEKIEKTVVVVLDNSWVEQDGVVIGGLTSGYVTDYRRFRKEMSSTVRYPKKENLSGISGAVTASQHKPETAWLEEFSSASPSSTHILLSHHPEYFPLVPPSVDLVLSGHAHGGQWAYYSFRRKRMCGVWSPGQGFLPRWTRGVYEDKRLVVSAGLANTASVPRLFNPTEVVYVEPE